MYKDKHGNQLNNRDDVICMECGIKFDEYLESRFPRANYLSRPADDLYYQLYSIRFDIAKRNVEALYQ